MKKSLYFAIFAVFAFFTSVLAVSLCSKTGIVTVVLDPSIGGTGYSYNNDAGVWKTNFSYGTVTGISTCQSVAGSAQGDFSVEISANGGENNGKYCWCKMTHPMASRWVFRSVNKSDDICWSNCTYSCGYGAEAVEALRVGLFGSVQQ